MKKIEIGHNYQLRTDKSFCMYIYNGYCQKIRKIYP